MKYEYVVSALKKPRTIFIKANKTNEPLSKRSFDSCEIIPKMLSFAIIRKTLTFIYKNNYY